VLIVGTYVFPEVYPLLEGAFAANAKIVHIDLDAYEIGKNFPVDIGLVSDPKLTLGALAGRIKEQMSPERTAAASERFEDARRAATAARQESIDRDRSLRAAMPLRASRFMEELARQLPEDAIIFDEALTSSPELTRHLPPTQPNQFFQTRGGSLGVGIPGALGIKLAAPDRPVIAFTGDGGSMYTMQALWTAAHHDIGAKLVICNNGSYMLLKHNILQYWRDQVGVAAHAFPRCFDLGSPTIDFVGMAASMGVRGTRVDHPDQVEIAIKEMLAEEGPFLIDMVIGDEMAT
jgi:thiamine pyrophosphate-dependent acetolactate synthase large subunit-like protein